MGRDGPFFSWFHRNLPELNFVYNIEVAVYPGLLIKNAYE
jgi:hypothetical protein